MSIVLAIKDEYNSDHRKRWKESGGGITVALKKLRRNDDKPKDLQLILASISILA